MTILFGVLSLIIFFIVLVFNVYSVSLAVKNCVRLDGSISRKRVLWEFKYLVRYYGAILLVVLLHVLMVYVCVFLVHTYILPIDIVEDAFSLLESDAATWKDAIRHGPQGSLDQQYEDWGVQRGYSPNVIKSIANFLFRNWLPLLIILFVIAVAVYFVQIKVLRRQAYYHVDRKRAHKEDESTRDSKGV